MRCVPRPRPTEAWTEGAGSPAAESNELTPGDPAATFTSQAPARGRRTAIVVVFGAASRVTAAFWAIAGAVAVSALVPSGPLRAMTGAAVSPWKMNSWLGARPLTRAVSTRPAGALLATR